MAKIKLKNLHRVISPIRDTLLKAHIQLAMKTAEEVLEEVKRKIPDEGGWYKIYRDSLMVVHEGNQVKIVGDASIAITTLPAETTAVFIEGTTAVAIVLQALNPWPVDMIPAIQGGLNASVRAVPASESEISGLRDRIYPQMNVVSRSLVDAGATVIDNGIPEINGKTYVDINFLAKRLEHGFGPFSRHPHWRPAANKAKMFLNEVTKEEKSKILKDIEKELK